MLEAQLRAEKIFRSLMELDAGSRPAALQTACGDNPGLAALVTSLLERHTAAADDDPLGAFSHLEPGRVIGRYVVKKRLGVGGMAEVWAVEHQTLGTRYALKVLLWASEALQQRLLTEGRTQARLQHDNILPVRDILNLSGTPALLMPLVEGPPLDRLLAGYTPSTDEALHLFSGILSGVMAAHDAGVIHRDLKPGNILLSTERGRVVPLVADFGLVKDLHTRGTRMTVAGVAMGTPAYAAPEQLDDAAGVGPAADIFSLGVILCRLLTGRLPFPGDSLDEIRRAHQQPPRLDGVPDGLRALLVDMLRPGPAARPTAAAVRQAITSGAASQSPGLREAVSAHRPPTSHAPSAAPRTPHNLPRPRDRFFGREAERARLAEQLAGGERLLTVTGPGGTGKTRLCQELGWQVMSAWSGVWWVDLSECRDLDSALVAVARALSAPIHEPDTATVGRLLASQGRCLVIFDNFEQLTAVAHQTVGTWLDATSEAAFVVTSRQPLRLRGERLLAVEPLDTGSGVALFIDRAAALSQHAPDLDADSPDLHQLIQLLDGLPLAIELAAARSRMLTPARLLKRLSRRFDLLKSRAQDRPSRQRTLRATLQWSWDLLQPHEQAALAQCSVFEGGFTLDAADEILDLSAFEDDPWVEDVLGELIDRSLLRSRAHGRIHRLSMLVSVQEFAREKLDRADPVFGRHAQHFSALGTEEGFGRIHAERKALLSDLDNLQAAARFALSQGDRTAAGQAAIALQELTSNIGPLSVPYDLLQACLQRWPDATDFLQVLMYWGHGSVSAVSRSEEQAMASYRAALAICDLSDPGGRGMAAQCRSDLGLLLARQQHFDEAEPHFLAGLEVLGSTRYEQQKRALLLSGLANLYRRSGQAARAVPLYREALAIQRRHQQRSAEGIFLNNLGLTYTALEQHEDARRTLSEALEKAREEGSRRTESILLGNLAALEVDLDERLRLVQQGHQLSLGTDDRHATLIALRKLVMAHIARGEAALAGAHLDEAERLAREGGQTSHAAGLLLARARLVWHERPADAADRLAVLCAQLEAGSYSAERGQVECLLAILDLDRDDSRAAHVRLSRARDLLRGSSDAPARRRVLIRLWEATRRLGEDATALEAEITGGLQQTPHHHNARLRWLCAQGRAASGESAARLSEEAQRLHREAGGWWTVAAVLREVEGLG